MNSYLVMQDYSLINIENKLYNYIWNKLFTTAKEKKFLTNILSHTDILIFGGVIREFVLNNYEKVDHRDVDMVIVNLNSKIEKLIEPYLIRKNSFGGYKLKIDKKLIDLWEFETTWAIKDLPLFGSISDYLPHTSFFNLNAVALSLLNKKIIVSNSFLSFLENRILDIEFEANPMPSLCIVKTYEYCKKYKIKISNILSDYIITNFIKSKDFLEDIQKKHYGKLLYSTNELVTFYIEIKQYTSETINH